MPSQGSSLTKKRALAIAHMTDEQERSVLISRLGRRRFVSALRARLIDRSSKGRLWRYSVGVWVRGDQLYPSLKEVRMGTVWDPFSIVNHNEQLLEVVNSTPSRNGRRKHYWLRVPMGSSDVFGNELNSVHGAVAWTFGLHGHGYRPKQET